MKLDFWNMVVAKESLEEVSSYWLPAFYSPTSFLNCFAQNRARNEEIPVDDLLHQYEVQPFMSADSPCSQPHSIYMHGLWLEGADWESQDGCLVETTKKTRFI
jgi:dynein heavy chain, axonemal